MIQIWERHECLVFDGYNSISFTFSAFRETDDQDEYTYILIFVWVATILNKRCIGLGCHFCESFSFYHYTLKFYFKKIFMLFFRVTTCSASIYPSNAFVTLN
jgi:hypothetical protein